jgi:hypothetical protein
MTVVTTVSYGFDPETEWDLIERFREMAKEEGGWKERTVCRFVVFEKTTFRATKFGAKKK